MNATEDVTASQAYASWAAEAPVSGDKAAMTAAKSAFIDVIACMIPGAREISARTLRKASSGWGEGPCTVVGETKMQSAPLAALANGTAAHALDFDDNFDPAKAHATAVLAPALLALGEERKSTGKDILASYIIGLQILARIGQGLNPYHRNRGWHATATIGVLGAAVACGRLLQLEAAQMCHALNIATSYAGGFMSQFGSMTKPLHAGKAAEAGVMAATFAEVGMTAAPETLDGPYGMAQLTVGPDLEDLRKRADYKREHGQTMHFETRSIGDPLAILEYGLKVKRFPTCASAHRALDAIIALKENHNFQASTVDRIDIHAPLSHFNNLMYTNPQNAMEAKFCVEYCAAVAIENGAITIKDFEDDALSKPSFRKLMSLVHRHPADKLESDFPTKVIITLSNGSSHESTVAAPLGRADNPLTTTQLLEKLMQCSFNILSSDRISMLTDTLAKLDTDTPVNDLMSLLRSKEPS